MKDEALREGQRGVELRPVEKNALMGPDRIYDLIRIYVMVGEEEAALDQIASLLSMKTHFSAPMLLADPALDPLRDHPRFPSLMR